MQRIKDIELFVSDMDGTVYLGDKLLDGALEFAQAVKDSGKRLIFFTNNASKNPEIYVEKLKKMGFDATRNDVVTAGDVTCTFLNKNHKGAKVYLVGTPALEKAFREHEINLTDGTEADIVVSSFDTTLTYEKLEKACTLIRNGALFYSTHPDFNCPTENGYIPDSGAICALITASTNVLPRYFGKPHKETADAISEISKIPLSKTAVIGDRLYTDIALGKNHGLLSILVLTGESTKDDITPDNAPDIVFSSIGDIIRFL